MVASRELPDEATGLFREPPDGFIAARNALVSSLRDQGRDDDAAAVKALRKPTVVAWALDQLAVRDPAGIEELLDAGAEVRAAQQSALTSTRGATERLRAATSARRASIGRLMTSAVAALSDAERVADAHREAIVTALETCSVDAEAGSHLRSGTLERPPAAAPGFGDVFGLAPVAERSTPDTELDGDDAGPARQGKPRRGNRTRATTDAGAGGDAAAAAAQVARLRRDRDAAARRAKKARSAADGFAHELEGMRRRLAVVERKHAEAAGAAAERETELVRAERALRAAEGDSQRDG